MAKNRPLFHTVCIRGNAEGLRGNQGAQRCAQPWDKLALRCCGWNQAFLFPGAPGHLDNCTNHLSEEIGNRSWGQKGYTQGGFRRSPSSLASPFWNLSERISAMIPWATLLWFHEQQAQTKLSCSEPVQLRWSLLSTYWYFQVCCKFQCKMPQQFMQNINFNSS